MKTVLLVIAAVFLSVVSGGCCICCRRWSDSGKETLILTTGQYRAYTNGQMKVAGHYKDGKPYLVEDTIYKICSNSNGPFRDSDVYPATRNTLNALSLYRYSGEADGDYMFVLPTLIIYPIVLVELPIQLVLDTVLLPWDLYVAPKAPEGYRRAR